MVKPLSFKGDKKPLKKRKRTEPSVDKENGATSSSATDKGKAVSSTMAAIDEDDGWANADIPDDINGPIVFAFPSTPPTALACDANGKIFTIPFRDIEGEDLSTAEPHDVRQVWVASRIADTGKFSFKGHHGKYLSCDSIGTWSATKEAISMEESFLPVKCEAGWSLQTVRDKFLTLEEIEGAGNKVEIRGDAEEIGFAQTWSIRGQKRFKKKVKTDGDNVKEKISRRELEKLAGKELDDDQVRMLKKAKRDGNLQSALLDIRQKGKHDKFAY